MTSAAERGPMLSTAEALTRVLALAGAAGPLGTEIVALPEADGRVLAGPLVAARTQPPWPVSAMDGYAVRSADATLGARLAVVGEAAAGRRAAAAIGPGEAVRIFTGAPMPVGADAVLIQEDAAREGETVTLRAAVRPGEAVRPEGGDFRAGAPLLEGPRRLSPEDVALAAAAGRPWLEVRRRPRVALLSLGDELRLPGEPLGPDDIVASNAFGVAALARRAGAEARLAPIAPDRLEALRATIRAAAAADVIVTLGGASDGAHDLARPAFAAEGMAPDFYKIAMRPGKPLMAGRLGATLVLGFPGNPVSAMVCARLFLLPALAVLQGLPGAAPARVAYPLAHAIPPNGPREHFARARLEPSEDGPRLRLAPDQDSSLLSVLAAADLLAAIPPGDPGRPAGAPLETVALDRS